MFSPSSPATCKPKQPLTYKNTCDLHYICDYASNMSNISVFLCTIFAMQGFFLSTSTATVTSIYSASLLNINHIVCSNSSATIKW